eukprot:1845426-Alexandrium_andersonii.AAC.1
MVKDPRRAPPVSGAHAQSAMKLNKRCSELRETPQPGSRKESSRAHARRQPGVHDTTSRAGEWSSA